MAKRLFESRIINPILNAIKNNLDYLTQKENLPQLAKLGFVFESLWYAGRICYGYGYSDWKPLIAAKNQCENNTKYKIEICDVGTEEQYNLVYDACLMHGREESDLLNFECFKNLIINGKEYSEIELMLQKPNKTMDEWIAIKTHPNYRYRQLYDSPQSVLDYLLCTIGTGYGYLNGFIIEEASGADQDKTLFAGWENADFKPSIKKVIDKILEDPDVKNVLDLSVAYLIEERRIREEKEKNRWNNILDNPKEVLQDEEWDEELKKMLEEFMKKAENIKLKPEPTPTPTPKNYHSYYNISEYSLIHLLDENSHISYLKAAYEICQDIINHENEEEEVNIQYAKNNIERFKTLIDKQD